MLFFFSGNGNVALDAARMLIKSKDILSSTDIGNICLLKLLIIVIIDNITILLATYAIESLKKSKIKHVHIVGRRGLAQVN
jgi:hypothetical protein